MQAASGNPREATEAVSFSFRIANRRLTVTVNGTRRHGSCVLDVNRSRTDVFLQGWFVLRGGQIGLERA